MADCGASLMPPAFRFLALAIFLALPVREAQALIIYGTGPNDTDNALNTADPGGGLPWPNVARFGAGNASGVYLGHGFVLTANHVNVVDSGILINGVSYLRDTTFAPLQITENDPATPYADVVDLKLVKIAGNPALPALPVIQKLPLTLALSDDLNLVATMIGWGVGKGGIILNQGWAWGGDGTRAQRWGTNKTLTAEDTALYSGYQYEVLVTRFRRSLGSDTAQIALGDSGGALFQQIGGTWRLSGVMTSVLAYQSGAALYDGILGPPDQPDESQYVRLARYGHLLRYENWARTRLGSATAAESADPDADGLSNLLEYAFHTDPETAASQTSPVAGLEPGFATLTYRKLLSATDLAYAVEATDSLAPADWQPVAVTEEVLNGTGLVWTIKAKVPVTTEPRKFLRLRVTRLP